MTIIKDPHLFNEQRLFVDLEGVLGRRLYLNVEGFNFAGSVKLEPAREMVERAEREGLIGPGSTLVESSSGNLGVALGMIAASKGYRFVCVVDPRCNPTTVQLLGEPAGTVVHGAMPWLSDHDETAVDISLDRGRPYLDSIYQPGWVLDNFGAETIAGAGSTAGPGPQSGPVPGPQLPAAAPMTDSVATSSLRRVAQ
ncbi:pyridoxal-phosphate dependent enzyme [Paeniglutamicibacter sp. NPDC012692]|uniref:pyridoxal-phosphate dependent enzyme n=1 Tax=Paeniglutamicibacter sp. NPDC012692 TaxID=3364388 RepID=UPI0036B92773